MRLIDADDATRVVESVLKKYGLDRESVVTDEIHDAIDNIQTAYDVEKVVEQLEEKKNSNPSMMFEADCWRKGIDDAIDIVRGGRE